jgi:hypothetical protein
LCKLCHKSYKDRHGIYSNFIKHLKRIHARENQQIVSSDAEYQQIVSSDAEHLTEESNVANDDRAAVDLSNTKFCRTCCFS